MKIIKVVAAVIKDGNRILATQRGYGDFKGGWEFPGGKVEEGESPQEALRREIKEELDVYINVQDYIMTIEHDYPKFHLSMDCFWCEIESGDMKLLEAKDARWLTHNQLDEVDWLEADLSLIELLNGQEFKKI